MERIPRWLPDGIRRQLQQLQQYLDISDPLCFYGSVLRGDFIPHKSDIDIAIFTDDTNHVLTKVKHFFHITNHNHVKKIVWKLNDNLIHGYKVEVTLQDKCHCEISLYSKKDKPALIDDYRKGQDIPIIPLLMLCAVKWFYYVIPILPTNMYASCKKFIIDGVVIHGKQSTFVSY